MGKTKAWLLILSLILSLINSVARAQNWSENASVPVGGRNNPFELSSSDLETYATAGVHHALNYPVTATGILLPYHAIKRFLNGDLKNPFKLFLTELVGAATPFSSFEDMEAWLGLVRDPNSNSPHRMGLTVLEAPNGATAFTISCAQCHVGNLFGKPVIGLTNRFPRANDFFHKGLGAIPNVPTFAFQWATKASDKETELIENLKNVAPYIGAKKPVQLGLDTSLAQVAISLAKRAPDAYATQNPYVTERFEKLNHFVADSKPAVWWNVKYKNRWLSDGSVVSGNPIFTNIIWNELGRGADLIQIEKWLSENPKTIEELTTAVFNTKAPQWADFLDPSTIDEASARAGEPIFKAHCARCHGNYLKVWSLPEAKNLNWKERMKTQKVFYFPNTPVENVGTDPGRYEGMRSLEQLNRLAISQKNQIVIKPQDGYVPPPLEGIWARWPYFHNNSAPTLCAVLTKGSKRPATYWAREANDPRTDFDSECNGYPSGEPDWDSDYDLFYDSSNEGLSRFGHDEGIFLINGQEILTPKQKNQLIQFLKTL